MAYPKPLSTLPGEKRLSTDEAAHVLSAVWNRVDEEAGLEELEIPGIPEALDPESLFEYDVPWTVEAHLSRGLYQAMHELEALQTKRSGGAAPLARLDVQGLES